LLGHIPTPEVASNCAFGGADRCDLFITCSNALRRIRVKQPGLPVPVRRH
jgi:sugar lactone lactonase YvrE